MSKFKKSKSFTLLEVLTVVFLSSVIIMASYSVYLISYKSYQRNSQNAELTQNARIALERMSREIRQTIDVVTVLPETQTEGTPPSEIKFQDGHSFWPTPTPSAGPSPTPSPTTDPCSTPSGKIQYITYYLSGNDLRRKTSHYAFAMAPDEWVAWNAQSEGGELPVETTDCDQIKAQKMTSLQFWGDEVITIRLSVADGANSYTFETKTLGRNIQ